MSSEPGLSRGHGGPSRSPEEPVVYSITGAQESLSEEQADRTKRYLFSMAVRTACVLLAIVIPGWPRWALIAGAVVLPYFAVVIANAGRRRRVPAPLAPVVPTRTAIGHAPTVLHHHGETVDDRH